MKINNPQSARVVFESFAEVVADLKTRGTNRNSGENRAAFAVSNYICGLLRNNLVLMSLSTSTKLQVLMLTGLYMQSPPVVE